MNHKYLGSVVNEGIEISEAIKMRKGQAKSNFNKMKTAFCSRDISLTQKEYAKVLCILNIVFRNGSVDFEKEK